MEIKDIEKKKLEDWQKKREAHFICPICGFVNHIKVNIPKHEEIEMFYCDSESGGCDTQLAIQIITKLELKTSFLDFNAKFKIKKDNK